MTTILPDSPMRRGSTYHNALDRLAHVERNWELNRDILKWRRGRFNLHCFAWRYMDNSILRTQVALGTNQLNRILITFVRRLREIWNFTRPWGRVDDDSGRDRVA
jgi:hypothetical protein